MWCIYTHINSVYRDRDIMQSIYSNLQTFALCCKYRNKTYDGSTCIRLSVDLEYLGESY